VAIIGILFFIFGFVTWLSSVLIPYLQIACELNNAESYLVAFSFYISYVIMAVPSGWILKKTSYKKGMTIGLSLMAIGSILFVPAAMLRTYYIFLIGLFVQGSGLAILQTAANPYITILGPRESAARRMSIMGIANAVAGVIAPLVLGAIVLDDSEEVKNKIASLVTSEKLMQLNLLAKKVIVPYLIMAAVLVLLAVFIYYSRLPEIGDEEETTPDVVRRAAGPAACAGGASGRQHPRLPRTPALPARLCDRHQRMGLRRRGGQGHRGEA
jgi:fucose permease